MEYADHRPPAEHRIRRLLADQFYGVLCTRGDGQPYGSMVAFACSDDLRYLVFATPRGTTKYRYLCAGPRVAVLVNDLNRHPEDFMKVEAVTATGQASELPPAESPPWRRLLLQRHPYLERFRSSPATALFAVRIARYHFVSSFDDLMAWEPADAGG
ncbi:MAG TPA: pyridoxamine 5'-phosphate oxidase family protein [candidate division Zixibacteria bacterium]|nr:pyridoxamine 5'-phosphate oxidase family protein [candidate division Zixibacteria bacterium]MDD4917477.1 pyridoxamine 5'-phosphate oxidase family protein [candidate division Zixibacteria bacterium]HOD67095.1 pyridoxamine 5'-phosphate oxidase family protein [candidate division Zixibacteria bacterium]HOZ07692.1 pyridoxamine 5'-phosphate oxidase family protein [candidate division Zixibacteria bacterium]HPI32661.1 pyridoxamine 5'-phosphate oxidase family protein [candidate division Zixibacteria 